MFSAPPHLGTVGSQMPPLKSAVPSSSQKLTPKGDAASSDRKTKGNHSSRNGGASDRSAKPKTSARKAPKDPVAKGAADGSAVISDEAVLAAAEAEEAAQPHKAGTQQATEEPPQASADGGDADAAVPPRMPKLTRAMTSRFQLATPRTLDAAAELAAHVLEREKTSELIPPEFFELGEVMCDMIEAIFFHVYGTGAGLTITEVSRSRPAAPP